MGKSKKYMVAYIGVVAFPGAWNSSQVNMAANKPLYKSSTKGVVLKLYLNIYNSNSRKY